MSRKRDRIKARFEALAEDGRAGLVTFITAGDPDAEISSAILHGLPAAGADVIELGMPFTDPMADGPAIQVSSQRALKSGQNMRRTLAMVAAFRETDDDTPIVLMDAIRLVERVVGKEAVLEYQPRHKADVMATWADIGKAERLLGWRPQVTFEEGVLRAAEWYRENRSWAKDVVT